MTLAKLQVVEATRRGTDGTSVETVRVAMRPGLLLLYGGPGLRAALGARLSELGLKVSLMRDSMCG